MEVDLFHPLSSNPYGRNSTQYDLCKTTFRSGSRKILGKWGSNMQNIPKNLRHIYESDEGKLLIQVDQAGAEALIVAYLMPPSNKLRQLFDYKIKIHNYLAIAFPTQWILEFPFVTEFPNVKISDLRTYPRWSEFEAAVKESDNNTVKPRYYYLYKKTGHSANYGIAENTFVETIAQDSDGQVRLTSKEGKIYLDGYHSLIPEIRGFYHRWVAAQYTKDGVLRNLHGFPITLTTKMHEHEYNKIYDKIPQSTVGCITHIAYTNLQYYIEDNNLDWDLLNNCHDSYLCQAPIDQAIDCAKIMKQFMEQELTSPVTGETFRMGSEVQIGRNWGNYKQGKNEDGLKEIKF